MHVLLIIGLLLIFTPDSGETWQWSPEDIELEITWHVLHTMDTWQTLNIVAHRYTEMNPNTGMHPKKETVMAYMTAWHAIHLMVSSILPPRYRHWWLWFSVGNKTLYVDHNARTMMPTHGMGISIRF